MSKPSRYTALLRQIANNASVQSDNTLQELGVTIPTYEVEVKHLKGYRSGLVSMIKEDSHIIQINEAILDIMESRGIPHNRCEEMVNDAVLQGIGQLLMPNASVEVLEEFSVMARHEDDGIQGLIQKHAVDVSSHNTEKSIALAVSPI